MLTHSARSAGRATWSLALHALIPLAAGLAPLAVVPSIVRTSGTEGWSSVATGLAIGAATAVIAELGWTIVGPQLVARARGHGERARLFEEASASRILALCLLLPIAIPLTAVLAAPHSLAACLVTVGVALGSLSPAWFFVGLGRPVSTLLCETVPRMIFCVGAAVVISSAGPLEAYGGALIASAVLCWLVSSRLTSTAVWPSRRAFASVPGRIRSQGVLVAGRSVTTIYKSLPVVFLAAFSPGAVAVYSALDRPLRMGLGVLVAVPNRLQSWVGTTDATLRRRRVRTAVLLNGIVGLLAAGVLLIAMPPTVAFLFRGEVQPPPLLVALGAILVAVISVSRGLGFALVVHGRAGSTTAAAVASAAVALSALVPASVLGGAEGTVSAVIAAETTGVVVQLAILTRSRLLHSSGVVAE